MTTSTASTQQQQYTSNKSRAGQEIHESVSARSIPPFHPGPAIGGEYCTKQGAERLANIIRAAWAKAGHDVAVLVEPSGKALIEAKQIYGVRMPGLFNGRPR